jgi:prophage maintenance system killer protein
MSFGGAVAGMIASIKANKRARVSTFEKIKNYKKSRKTELFFPKKATKRDLTEIAKKIQKENKSTFFKNAPFLIIAILVLLYIVRLDTSS